MKSSREQFEEWYLENWGHTEDDHETLFEREPDCHEDYYRFGVRLAHHSWQASREAIEIGLPSMEDPANFFCEVYDCDMVHESLANCGLKVKS